jgi:hypothetical protein
MEKFLYRNVLIRLTTGLAPVHLIWRLQDVNYRNSDVTWRANSVELVAAGTLRLLKSLVNGFFMMRFNGLAGFVRVNRAPGGQIHAIPQKNRHKKRQAVASLPFLNHALRAPVTGR